MDDGLGQEMWKTVEMYAENNDLWLADFVAVWARMSQNGNQNLIDGPKNVLMSRCCIHSSVSYMKGSSITDFTAENALDCQAQCRSTSGCQWFAYTVDGRTCSLKSSRPDPSQLDYSENDNLGGPPSCPADENECEAYKSL